MSDSPNIQSKDDVRSISTPGVSVRILIIAILFLSAFLRLPTLNEGLPYFYKEDEAHHFNRVMRMMQSGDLNPHYFHKPSLHFYMRLPVAAASFLWTVKNGHIRSVQEIKTKDPSGLAGYNFTASHPGMVKWNRALSLAFCLGSIALAMLLAYTLYPSRVSVACTGLLLAFSPDFIAESSVIGVDMPMTFFVIASSYLAVMSRKKSSKQLLYFSAVCAGLALSTKYNALPVVAVPLLAALGASLPWYHALLVLVTSFLSFFAGSPYILVSIPLFLDQFAYEIWHYGIAGHVGHSAEPGVAQFLFYSNWLMESALGYLPVLLMAPGLFLIAYHKKIDGAIAFVFPLFFGLLMINQKANFTRNMLVILPFMAILAAQGISFLKHFGFVKKSSLLFIAVLVFLAQPLYQAFDTIAATEHLDSRHAVSDYLMKEKFDGATALDGSLWLPQFVTSYKGKVSLSVPGMTRMKELTDPGALYNDGYDRVVFGPRANASLPVNTLDITKEFQGIDDAQRIVKNPYVRIARIKEDEALSVLRKSALLTFKKTSDGTFCLQGESFVAVESLSEGHCWIQKRVTSFQGVSGKMKLSVMNPWDGQRLRIETQKGDVLFDNNITVGDFQTIEFVVPETSETLLLFLSKVYAPQSKGLNNDSRHLGLAVR